MIRLLKSILYLGINDEYDIKTQNRTFLLNGISIFLLTLEIVLILIKLLLHNSTNISFNLYTLFVGCLPIFYFHYKGYIKWSGGYFFGINFITIFTVNWYYLFQGRIYSLDNPYIITCTFALLMFDGVLKNILFLLSAVNYVCFKFAIPHFTNLSSPSFQEIITNSLLTIGLLYALVEAFSRSYKESQGIILEKNTLLSKQAAELQEQTQQLQEANHMKEHLFTIVSHDLRSPIVALKLFLSKSIKTPAPPTNWNQIKQQLALNVDNLHLLTDNLLFWSLGQSKGFQVKKRNLNLQDLIYDILELAALMLESKNIRLIKNLSTVEVFADETHVQIILNNLIQNAIKFSPMEGTIRIETSKQGNNLYFVIFNDIAKVSPSSSTEGTGLGLALSANLATLNDAVLTYGMQPDSTFKSQLEWQAL